MTVGLVPTVTPHIYACKVYYIIMKERNAYGID
jgi:hypothetical protein